jgi:serine/threonine protein kinase
MKKASAEEQKSIGRYTILCKIGQGGMGKVYKVRDTLLSRIVALKTLNCEVTPNSTVTQRFLREAKSNAQLQHPNIVTLYDFGEHNGTYFLTMDFIEGGSLESLIKSQKLSFSRICQIMVNILDAIGYAHGKGIVHRDIKPANILIGKDGKPFVTDFGLAKAMDVDTKLSQTGAIMGTLSYMSPEQAGLFPGVPVDGQSDIYSLGVMFYQMLTGSLPHQGDTPYIILAKLTTQEIQKARELNPEIPPVLERVCMKALAKDKRERYSTAEEMAKEIRAFIESVASDKTVGEETFVSPTSATVPVPRGGSIESVGSDKTMGEETVISPTSATVPGPLGSEETVISHTSATVSGPHAETSRSSAISEATKQQKKQGTRIATRRSSQLKAPVTRRSSQLKAPVARRSSQLKYPVVWFSITLVIIAGFIGIIFSQKKSQTLAVRQAAPIEKPNEQPLAVRQTAPIEKPNEQKRGSDKTTPVASGIAVKPKDTSLLDDFESGDMKSKIGGVWKTMADETWEGNSRGKAMIVERGYQSKKSLQFDYRFGEKLPNPCVCLVLVMNENGNQPKDLSMYEGFSFRLNGKGEYVVMISSIYQGNNNEIYPYTINCSDDWQSVTFAFPSAEQRINLREVNFIAVEFTKKFIPTKRDGQFLLDDFEFIPKATYK